MWGGRLGLRMSVTKATLAALLEEKIGLNLRESGDMVDGFFDEIRVALCLRGRVSLSNFGVFEVKKKAERPGRNPKTGESVTITPRRVVSFRPSPSLRKKCGPPSNYQGAW